MRLSLPDILESMSLREKELWCETIVSAMVAFYFFSRTFSYLILGDIALLTDEMGGLIARTIAYAIGLSIIGYILVQLAHDTEETGKEARMEPKDERDRLFDNRAHRIGYLVLMVALSALLFHIAVEEISGRQTLPFTLTPLAIAHLLLGLMTIASLAKACAALFFYRRGY